MRILVVGAGALGGYFGGRLQQAGRDVSFLVRPGRAEQLRRGGLRIRSQFGDADLTPRLVSPGAIDGPYDLILLSVKAYSLEAAMADVAPAVGPGTSIIPVLNGMRHLDLLAERFGAERILGGYAGIIATLGPEGEVLQQMLPMHDLVYGETGGAMTERVQRIAAVFEGVNAAARASERIIAQMWEKWVVLSTNAGITCMMRAPLGDVVAAPGGRETILAMLEESRQVAAASGHEPTAEVMTTWSGRLTEAGSPVVASMMRDIERGGPTEGEHVLGDIVQRAEQMGVATPLLRLARCHVAAYENRRRREAAP